MKLQSTIEHDIEILVPIGFIDKYALSFRLNLKSANKFSVIKTKTILFGNQNVINKFLW